MGSDWQKENIGIATCFEDRDGNIVMEQEKIWGI